MPIIFKKDNLKKILAGTKTQTRRKGKMKFKLGHIYGVKDEYYAKATAHVKITRKFRERLGDISMEDVQKEGYCNIWEFKAVWIKLHGSWNPDTVVTVYEFQLYKGNGRTQNRINGYVKSAQN